MSFTKTFSTWTSFQTSHPPLRTKQDWHQYPALLLGEQRRYTSFLVGSYLFSIFNLLSSCPFCLVFVLGRPGVSISWRHERDIWSVCIFENMYGFREFRKCAVLYFQIFHYLNRPTVRWAGVYRLNPIIYPKCTVIVEWRQVYWATPLNFNLSLSLHFWVNVRFFRVRNWRDSGWWMSFR